MNRRAGFEPVLSLILTLAMGSANSPWLPFYLVFPMIIVMHLVADAFFLLYRICTQ
jgi:hypothetical protein